MVRVAVEFFGIPRLRTGVPSIEIEAITTQDALRQVMAAFPDLADLLTTDGRLSPHYLLSRNGETFDVALMEPLTDGTRLLLLSADAGG